MYLRKDFINLINFVVFSQHDAEQIRNTAREIGFEADIIVTDEDMVSQICRQKAELGVKVFLFYGQQTYRIGEGYMLGVFGKKHCGLY